MQIGTFVTSSRLRSAAFWKNITGLKSHMNGYDFNFNSWQNQSWDCLTIPYSMVPIKRSVFLLYGMKNTTHKIGT